MGKKKILIAVILIVIGLVGYFAFHKSPKPATSSSTQAVAVNNAVLITKSDSSFGQYLADPGSKTLYTYGPDTAGVSNCTGGCLTSWPAYQDTGPTTGLPANIGTIKRSDNGEIQYTYKGMPLYYFANDSVGQVSGNGVSGFTVAKP
jgi:predicted lipoprotein with Yx(FWY)xxD motif